MRIISGAHGGRRLEAPAWDGVRPTSDRLRETLFNVLAPRIRGSRVLDGCAGTGAIGIEALSRGAAHVTFVDRDRRSTELVARNLARCGIAEGFAIIRADLGGPGARLPHAPFDLVLLDPPYDVDPEALVRAAGTSLAADGQLVLEHARRRPVPDRIGTLVRVRQLRAGDSVLSFFSHDAGVPSGDDQP